MRRIRLDMTLMDADWRISRLRNMVYRILNQHGRQVYVEQVDSKRMSKWIVDVWNHRRSNAKLWKNWRWTYMKRKREILWCCANCGRTCWKVSCSGSRKQYEEGRKKFSKSKEWESFGFWYKQVTKKKCLECDTTQHSIRNYPSCAPGEAELLLDQGRFPWKKLWRVKIRVSKVSVFGTSGEIKASMDGIGNVKMLLH